MPGPDGFPAAYDALLARWPVPVESVDVPTAGGTTRVNSCGPADAPPLVLLSGGGATSTVWLANVRRLSARHRVHAVDTIGQAGRSVVDDRPPRGEADLMAWLDEVMSALGVDRTALCGHSYGAWLGLCYALHAPERVRAAVLLDPTRCFAGYRAAYLLKAAPLFLRPSRRTWRRFLAWETGGVAVDEDWARLTALGTERRWGRTVDPRPPAAERLRACRVPMLVVTAARSRAHDPAAVGERAKALLPQARTHVLPTATHHTVPLAHADELDPLILDFLDFLA